MSEDGPGTGAAGLSGRLVEVVVRSRGRWASDQGSRAQGCPKTAPRRLKMTVQNGLKIGHDGARRHQDDFPDGPKMARDLERIVLWRHCSRFCLVVSSICSHWSGIASIQVKFKGIIGV